MSLFVFFVLAALAVGSAAGLLVRRNPIHGALFLVVNLGTIAALFLTLRAEFLAALGALFDERSPSVKWLIRELAQRAHAAGCTVSLCGQAPSDHPEFAAFLVEAGFDSISVNPDSVVRVIEHVARAEGAAEAGEQPAAPH